MDGMNRSKLKQNVFWMVKHQKNDEVCKKIEKYSDLVLKSGGSLRLNRPTIKLQEDADLDGQSD